MFRCRDHLPHTPGTKVRWSGCFIQGHWLQKSSCSDQLTFLIKSEAVCATNLQWQTPLQTVREQMPVTLY